MKEIIRRYNANGIEIRVAKYTEGRRVLFHVEHDMESVQGGEWFGENDRTRAIMAAQFLVGWIARNGYTAGTVGLGCKAV